MMPNMPVPSAPPGAGAEQSSAAPAMPQGEELKRLIMEVVGRLRTMAEKGGLNFDEIVSGGGQAQPPMSSPPMM